MNKRRLARIGLVGAVCVLVLFSVFYRLDWLRVTPGRASVVQVRTRPGEAPAAPAVPPELKDSVPSSSAGSGAESRKERYRKLVSLMSLYANSSEDKRHALGAEIVALLGKLGVKEVLFEILENEKDVAARSIALRTLLSHEEYPQLGADYFAMVRYQDNSLIKDDQLIRIIEGIVVDRTADPVLRKAALAGLPFLPLQRAEAFLRTVLSEKGALESDALAICKSMLYFDQAARNNKISESPERRIVSQEFKAFVLQNAAEAYTSPTSSEEDRLRASLLLMNQPEWVFQSFDNVNLEASADLRSGIVAKAGLMLIENPQQEKAPWLFDRLVKIATGTGDTEMRGAALASLGDEKLKPTFGETIERTLMTLVFDDSQEEDLRVAAITALGDGGYFESKDMLTKLTSDASVKISVAASSALEELEKPRKRARK